MGVKRVAVVLAVACAAGLYFATQAHFAFPEEYRRPFGEALVLNLIFYWLWAAAVPVVVWLGRRFPASRLSSLAVHLVAAPLLTVTQLLLAAPLCTLLLAKRVDLAAMVRLNFHSSLPTYIVILVASWAFDHHAKFRDRERRAAELEVGLARARLEALQRQLDPHFLFNTLHAISSLMYENAAAADGMMTRLSDLLRRSLARGGASEVSVREELGLLADYLAIEELRLDERLRVTRDIAPDALDVRVPPLLLQPIVENAVRHAIAPRPSGGRIDVGARRDGDDLRIDVVDDGPGLPAGGVREGIGLANTRARLLALYGARGQMTILPAGAGGVRVTLRVPWRTS
jgi:two-component system LytT family sensor kinase